MFSRFGIPFLMLLRPKMSLFKSYQKIHKVTTFGPKSVKIADPLPKTKYTTLVLANFWTPHMNYFGSLLGPKESAEPGAVTHCAFGAPGPAGPF
mgnify:CR=1 FL=1